MKILVREKRDIPSSARKLLQYKTGCRLFAFYGPVGAGKTTIIKAAGEYLGAIDIISSPTFNIINEYRTQEGGLLYHIDFYRMRSPGEINDLGIEEYLSSGSYCFIEWPELIEELLPEEVIRIKITVGENEERTLEIS